MTIERVFVRGKPRKSLLLKLDPLWWLANSDEPWPPMWFRTQHWPGWPYWVQVIGWYLRNPFHNLGAYVLGVADRDFTVIGPAPVMTTHPREDAKNAGDPDWLRLPPWKWHYLAVGWMRLPFISYEGPSWRFYAGWSHFGFLGFKLNRHRT